MKFSGSVKNTKIHQGIQEGNIVLIGDGEWTISSLLGNQVILSGIDSLGNKHEITIPIDQLVNLQIFRKNWQGIGINPSQTQRLN